MTRIVLVALIAIVPAAHALAQTKAPAKADGARTGKFATPKPGADTSRAAPRAADCSEYGAGFKPAGGTGACVKIGGYVRGQAVSR